MNCIPVISSDTVLFAAIAGILTSRFGNSVEALQISSADEAVEVLNTEMPDLFFINFSDPGLDVDELLGNIMADPWLLHGGIVAVCADSDRMRELEEMRGVNFISIIAVDDLERDLPKVVDIVQGNRRILFQREIGADLVSNISGSFKLNNDPLEAGCYANLICNFLYNANRIDPEGKFKLNFALYEMLINAIEHGNCGITYDEKTAWLESHGSIADLVAAKAADPAVGARKVTFEYSLTPGKAAFTIADEGSGFDWRAAKDPTATENVMELHGRGIAMTRSFTRGFRYNEKGNEVGFEIVYQPGEAQLTPALLADLRSRDLSPGDMVFKQGDSGDFLYYIVKGRYEVLIGDRVVSTLTADDIFMGEMSFLLNNKRSATVRAQTEGRLVEISKKDFVNAVKKKPHYALFLSRLLAQRIERGNRK